MTRQKYSKTPPPPRHVENISHISNIPNIPNQTPSFSGTMIQGMALGAGSSIGHKVVDSIFTGKPEEKSEPKNEKICNDLDIYSIEFNRCMSKNDNNYQECIPLLDTYFKCKGKSV